MNNLSIDSLNSTLDCSNIYLEINSKNYQETEDYHTIITNINNCKKVIAIFKKWKENVIYLVDKCLPSLNNYCKFLEDLINKTKNDFDWEINFETFQTKPNLNNFFQSIKDTINNENIQKQEIENISNCALKLIENIKKNNILKDVSKLNIKEMKKMKLIHEKKDNSKINEEYTCFSPLNNNNYMLFGNKNGDVEIYDFMENSGLTINENEQDYKLKLRIKAFNNEVKYICELDKDLFVVSGGNNEIKIIECKDNISKYSIIQEIYIPDSNIYSMITFPILSSQEKRYFLCFATDKNILIYKSNKSPKFLNTLDNENNQEELTFELYKTIEVNTLTHCLIETDNKYLIAACPNEKTIKFFDMTNDFIEVANLDDINVTRGSNIFTVIPNEKKLIVACDDGFKIISIEKKKKFKGVHCKYSVLSLDMLNENTIICCCSQENKNILKQYEINKSNFELSKKAQILNKNNDEIRKLQKINEKIFFIDNRNIINYLI